MKEKIILVVDDDDINIFALSSVLKSKVAKIHTASDGIECLEFLRKNTVDIVLLDIMMPIMDGYQTLKEIRNDNTLKHLPVIALTALAMVGDKEKCIEAGANDYVTKPIDITILIEKMKILFGQV